MVAATEISIGIKDLNKQMKLDFSEELRFGIGIHRKYYCWDDGLW